MSEYDARDDAMKSWQLAIEVLRKERGAASGETCTPGTKNEGTRFVVSSYPIKLGSSTVCGDSGANLCPKTDTAGGITRPDSVPAHGACHKPSFFAPFDMSGPRGS